MAEEITTAKDRLISAFHEEDDDGDLFEMRPDSGDAIEPELSEEEKYALLELN